MLSYLFLAILFVARTTSLSFVSDDKAQPTGPDGQTTRSEDAQSDILRQLLNQETLIRMALDRKVSDLVNDMADLKKYVQTSTKQLQDSKREIETNNKQLQDAKREIETNNKQLQDAKREIETNNKQLQDAKREIETNNQQLQDTKAEIVSLRNEVLSLKNQNRKSKADALKFQEKINVRFVRTDENITQVVNSQEQLNTNLNERFVTFQINTSYNIVDIQTKMDVLNMSLLDLKKQTTKLNTSLPEVIDKNLADASDNWNRSLSELNNRFVYTWSKLNNDHANKMAQLSDGINTSINVVKAEVNQSQKAQLELSSAISSVVLSLEVIRRNMSLLNGLAKDTPEAFTAGMTSSSNTWQGDILVFPHVITNKGQGYSSSSGKFTAPRDGTYVFTVTVMSYYNNDLKLDIVHDGVSKVRAYSYSHTSHQTGTNLVVLELDRGDTVWVKRVYGQGYYAEAVPLTTFSGFIL
uniref:Myosin heavy chain, clone 203-like n=1 Tax=Crassostrea virginica TaxID=6565 RepID=A0A8B8EAI4_CRAVI|nr:myosin heavy chain, clone 203-like [Crassostrea virginica]